MSETRTFTGADRLNTIFHLLLETVPTSSQSYPSPNMSFVSFLLKPPVIGAPSAGDVGPKTLKGVGLKDGVRLY